MKLSHAEDLAKLHRSLIPYSINSLLGEKYLTRVYRKNITNECIFGFIAIDESSGQILAFITFAEDLKKIKLNTIHCFTLNVIIQFIKNMVNINFWISFKDLIALGKFHRYIEKNYLYILGWGALGNTSGVASHLFSLMASHAKENNLEIWLDVRKINSKVVETYKKLGFTPVGETAASVVFKK